MTIDLTDIIKAIMALIAALITGYLIPYIKTKTGEKRFQEIQNWVKIAVEAAEMIFKETGMGKEKKEYVLNFLKNMGFTVDFDELDKMIEAAVLELQKEGKKEIIKNPEKEDK